ncbi:S8 family serine peptidase [Methylorubrum sp. Q1]|uniref:S8 family peptidase n=1 Tax=Methylorubrum sp. Q1 TaxID=2562453 RepID=UPI00187D632B|nr:S8 family serine peptidase [Methylorubrum sp. Q1]
MRYFIVTPEQGVMTRSKDVIAMGPDTTVATYASKTDPNVLVADLDPQTAQALTQEGAVLYEDVQFSVLDGIEGVPKGARYWEPEDAAHPMLEVGGLAEVMDQVNAPAAWGRSKGGNVTIAVIDTGVAGGLGEFATARRSSLDIQSAFKGQHWEDPKGHGSMCAAIACGSQSDGGRHDGVAPQATLVAARSNLNATDIFAIYDELIDAKRRGIISGPLVISNSYGLYRCDPEPRLEEDHPYLRNVLLAIDNGITVVFAAGNNHANGLCNHDPTADGPSTIWGVNSHERVISVGTVDRDGANQKLPNPHVNSSRGPGQWSGKLPKPDVVAPTFGEIVWGAGRRVMEWWGTSGACPQVAGLAALLLSLKPDLTPEQIGDLIRSTAKELSGPPNCVGHGVIDCEAAVAALLSA